MTRSATYIGRLSVLWIVVQGGILVFIVMVPLHRAIIAPLGVLSRQLRAFRKTSDLNLSLDTEQEGEIGEISREFALFPQSGGGSFGGSLTLPTFAGDKVPCRCRWPQRADLTGVRHLPGRALLGTE
jgi:hypothetical protein